MFTTRKYRIDHPTQSVTQSRSHAHGKPKSCPPIAKPAKWNSHAPEDDDPDILAPIPPNPLHLPNHSHSTISQTTMTTQSPHLLPLPMYQYSHLQHHLQHHPPSSTVSTQTDSPTLYITFHPHNFKEQQTIISRNLYIFKALSIFHNHGTIISKGRWNHDLIKELLGNHGPLHIKDNKVLYYKSWAKIMQNIHPDRCSHPQTTETSSIYNSAKDFISQS